MQSSTRRLVTHSGTFHCDDAFAYAVLRLALGLTTPGIDHSLTRTRDPALIAAADIVWDVGAVHDAASGRFDHHQRGAPVRAGSLIPFSAAGLVWQVYGAAAVRAALLPADEAAAEDVAAAIDADVIRRIDATDNGVETFGDTLNLSSMVEDCNPAWDSLRVGDQTAEDRAFIKASALAESFLRHRVESTRARLAVAAVVAVSYAQAANPRLLELARKMPWQDAVFAQDLAVLYAVYPVPGGNWMVDAMPAQPGSSALRLPLPVAWAGLHGDTLAALCEVADAVFVHPRRFVAAARSREGAMAMAAAAIALGHASGGAARAEIDRETIASARPGTVHSP